MSRTPALVAAMAYLLLAVVTARAAMNLTPLHPLAHAVLVALTGAFVWLAGFSLTTARWRRPP